MAPSTQPLEKTAAQTELRSDSEQQAWLRPEQVEAEAELELQVERPEAPEPLTLPPLLAAFMPLRYLVMWNFSSLLQTNHF